MVEMRSKNFKMKVRTNILLQFAAFLEDSTEAEVIERALIKTTALEVVRALRLANASELKDSLENYLTKARYMTQELNRTSVDNWKIAFLEDSWELTMNDHVWPWRKAAYVSSEVIDESPHIPSDDEDESSALDKGKDGQSELDSIRQRNFRVTENCTVLLRFLSYHLNTSEAKVIHYALTTLTALKIVTNNMLREDLPEQLYREHAKLYAQGKAGSAMAKYISTFLNSNDDQHDWYVDTDDRGLPRLLAAEPLPDDPDNRDRDDEGNEVQHWMLWPWQEVWTSEYQDLLSRNITLEIEDLYGPPKN